ncbi:GNAT family N-acetyltransferase [Microlunatus sp. Gsoil 973]|uniref:GNAT family N-acetyltransferase n=1 Tax=Microlunatus sp. Gsoil 973 TaxID=2672569 RepID=UPI0012B473B2|nr:GNAT family N-acetyltransferase [Microlunatus sp. Gsoil 973]QGN33466.1 GNAT family N-acetyltransferase [Microlunatus sp. Gsoil 973]
MSQHPTPPHHAELTLETVVSDQIESFERAVTLGFHSDYHGDEWEHDRKAYQEGRWFGFRSGDRWVSSALSSSRRMVVPGGTVDVAAVTAVTVAPGFRRRGLLTQMMRHQLTTISEPVALLFATESLIYGRFGYGGVTRQLRLSGRTRELQFLPEVDLGDGSVDEVSVDQYRMLVPGLRSSFLPDRPAHLERDDIWWESVLADPERWRDGASSRRFAVHFAVDGTADGFAAFRTKRQSSIVDHGREVQVEELDAGNSQAYAALWRWLLDLDLVRAVSRPNAPVDEPLHQLLADQRMIKTELTDAAYARIVDVPAALQARTYSDDLDLVIQIVDRFLPDAGGRFRIQAGVDGATVARTDDAPDLTLSARQLAAGYLGGTPFSAFARAGLVEEHTPGAVRAATSAFRSDRAPFCPDFF